MISNEQKLALVRFAMGGVGLGIAYVMSLEDHLHDTFSRLERMMMKLLVAQAWLIERASELERRGKPRHATPYVVRH